jgi:rare lipoprotein A
VSGAATAPPVAAQELPAPVTQPLVAATPANAAVTEQVTTVPVPAATSIYVQAGAFTVAENARRVEGKLRQLGARVSSSVRDGKTVYRVRIGPLQDVSAADATLAAVQALGQFDARIVIE